MWQRLCCVEVLEASMIALNDFGPQTLEIPEGTKVSIGYRLSMPTDLRFQHPPRWDLGMHCAHSLRTRFWQD